MHEMQNLPIGTHTEGSKSNSSAAAAYVVNNSAVNFRLNIDVTITQAELMAILGALDHAVINHVRPFIHSDSLTAIHILMNNKESERLLCNCILSAAKYIESIPLIRSQVMLELRATNVQIHMQKKDYKEKLWITG